MLCKCTVSSQICPPILKNVCTINLNGILKIANHKQVDNFTCWDFLSLQPNSAENPLSISCSHFVPCRPDSCVQQYPASRHKGNSLWVFGPVCPGAVPQTPGRLWAHATASTKESGPHHPAVAQCRMQAVWYFFYSQHVQQLCWCTPQEKRLLENILLFGLTLASVLEVVDDLFKDTAMRACLNIECWGTFLFKRINIQMNCIVFFFYVLYLLRSLHLCLFFSYFFLLNRTLKCARVSRFRPNHETLKQVLWNFTRSGLI